MTTITRLRETVASLAEASTSQDGPGRMLVRLIEGDRWGSSGFYTNEVLQRDGAAAFPAGTHMFLDHPTVTEDAERPERSVRDLAARLVEDAHFDSDGLYAEIEVFPHWRPLVEGLADAVGLSIRAGGQVEQGQAPDGRTGRLVTALAESNGSHSVDFVPRAGAGGQVMSLLESARNVPLHEGHGMTANDLRDLLSTAVKDEHGGEGVYVWVRDYTDDWIVFEREADDDPSGLFQQSYTVTDGQVAFSGDPVEVVVHTEYRPASESPVRTQSSVPQAAQEGAMPESPNTDQLRESVTALQEQVTTLTTERDEARTNEARLQEALLLRDARDAASQILDESEHDLRPAAQKRVLEAATRGDIPTSEVNGATVIDRDALAETVNRLAGEEVAYLAESTGAGYVRGVGTGGGGGGEDLDAEGIRKKYGLSEAAVNLITS